MKKTFRIFSLMILSIMMCAISSCSDSGPNYDTNLLVGKWTCNDYTLVEIAGDTDHLEVEIPASVEFHADGTCTWESPETGEKRTANYTLAEELLTVYTTGQENVMGNVYTVMELTETNLTLQMDFPAICKINIYLSK